MVSIRDFRLFLGYGVVGSGSVGLITVRRKPPIPQPKRPIEIKENTQFYSNGIRFFNPELATISESADFVPVVVKTNDLGIKTNLKPNQEWTTSLYQGVDEVTIENSQSFSGGEDEVSGMYPYGTGNLNIQDNQLQRSLNVAKIELAKIIGIQDSEEDETNYDSWIMDDPSVREGLMMIAMYRLQNNTTQSLQFNPPLSGESSSPAREKYFRHKEWKPLVEQVTQLVAHRRNVLAFMPDVPGGA